MSNAFDKASLVMLPHAYEDGKLYSLKPTDRSGDFTFSRGSDTATRVGEDGYIKKEYANLLTQSNSFDTSPWSNVNNTNYTITSGQTGYDGSNDAWLLDKINTGNQYLRHQSLSTGFVWTASIYAKANTADSVMIYVPGGYATFRLTQGGDVISSGSQPVDTKIEDVGNGWFRCSVTGTNPQSSYFVQPKDATGAHTIGSIYIQDAQLNQGLVAQDYLETTTAPVYGGLTDNMPRLDYTDATCPSLLLEPSRTNRIPHSEYYNSFLNYGTGNAVFTPNVATSPENVENAYKIILNSGRTSGGGAVSSWAGAFTQGESITFSIFLKADGFDEVQLGGYFQNENATFNLRDGSVISQASNVTNAYSVPFGNDWYRCVVTYIFQNAIGNNFLYSGYKVLAKSNGVSLIGDGVKGVLAYGAQFEQGSYPTSYIPTYGSSQTRAAEVMTSDTSSFGITEKFTLFIDTNGALVSGTSLNTLGDLRWYTQSTNKYRFYKNSDAIFLGNSIQVNDRTKIALKITATECKTFVDGVLHSTISLTTPFASFDRIFRNTETKVKDELNQITLFPTALSDSECISLTTL